MRDRLAECARDLGIEVRVQRLQASTRTVSDAATGFAIGGVPPFGHDLPVIFDEELLRHERVWAAAGDPHSLFCVDPRRLADCTEAQVSSVGAVLA